MANYQGGRAAYTAMVTWLCENDPEYSGRKRGDFRWTALPVEQKKMWAVIAETVLRKHFETNPK